MASCIQVNVYYKQQVNTNEPFTFDAIFHRIQILLYKLKYGKKEPNRTKYYMVFRYFGDP